MGFCFHRTREKNHRKGENLAEGQERGKGEMEDKRGGNKASRWKVQPIPPLFWSLFSRCGIQFAAPFS